MLIIDLLFFFFERMEGNKVVEKGWVVMDPNKCLIKSTFTSKRGDSIVSMSGSYTNWASLRRIGYSCVKATRTIEIEK